MSQGFHSPPRSSRPPDLHAIETLSEAITDGVGDGAQPEACPRPSAATRALSFEQLLHLGAKRLAPIAREQSQEQSIDRHWLTRLQQPARAAVADQRGEASCFGARHTLAGGGSAESSAGVRQQNRGRLGAARLRRSAHRPTGGGGCDRNSRGGAALRPDGLDVGDEIPAVARLVAEREEDLEHEWLERHASAPRGAIVSI